MTNESLISVLPLGQAGFRLNLGNNIVYIDPYLSNYVEKIEGELARRLVPIGLEPDRITDADWVLITHEHIDHCDPETIVPISIASTGARFMGPGVVCEKLVDFGIHESRITEAPERWESLEDNIGIRCVPAAHPEVERDENGQLVYIGYLISYSGRKIYHSGDTTVNDALLSELAKENGIDIAFVSVNEKNYYRDKLGIIGNMSVRDAFGLAQEAKVKKFVPMHWDMFETNCVYRDEIELLYEKMKPDFEIHINPGVI
jgi:L-ascorbate 6-phosphate lactonase